MTINTARMTERECAQAWLDNEGKADRKALRERMVERAKHKPAWKHLLAHADAGNIAGVKAHAASGDERRRLMAALHEKPAKPAKAKAAKPANDDDPKAVLAAAIAAMDKAELAAFLVSALVK